MKRFIIIITFTVALCCANAQERLFSDMPCEHITTDIQGNVFLANGSNLNMLPADGAKPLNYSEPTYGNIAQVDAGIASKILVFYRESGTIILLNNELSPIGNPLNLFNKSLMTVSLAAMGNPNKIVLYDAANQDLLITDLNLNSINRTHISFPGDFRPTDMQVIPEHRIALLDTLHGICLFDFFGTFEKEIPIPGVKTMQLMKDQILYLKDNTMYRYSLPTSSSSMSIEEIDIHLPNIRQFHIFQNTLYYIVERNVAKIKVL
ncbi:MAG: hypothetical protein K5882_02740 [Bacteroidales bacterium]|nr:hypothetical protein [Bacteroidales bacterium]